MPVTGFHFGVGVLAKGLWPRQVSLLAFLSSQVAIDTEVAYYMIVRREYPFHRHLHTLIGSSAVGLAVGLGVVVAGVVLRRLAGPRWQVPDLHEASWIPALVGGLAGGLTHPLLDAVMHEAVVPLWPIADGNPFLLAVSISVLHGGLVATGIVGGAMVAYRVRKMLRLPAGS